MTEHNTPWTDIKRADSSNTNVSKYVFTREDAVAEAVLYKYPTFEERTVICCSTQSGCPVGCRFCGAGDHFVRSLTAEEIVSQTDYMLNTRDIDPSVVGRMQIMFMSMGEPLLNQKNLVTAIRELYRKYPKAALLVSTTAPRVDFSILRQTSIEVPTVGLQFSIHESTDVSRNQLIPFAQKLTLVEIAKEGEAWAKATSRHPFFNYCAHPGNNSDGDVSRLLDLFDPRLWCATVSVICEREEHVSAANDRQRTLATDFARKLLKAGYDVRTFDPAGQDDIGGGCGQLWYVQEWMRNRPNLVRKSVGHSLPVIHTPGA